MLCNLAAAEFVMPVGSLSPMSQLPSIEKLMEERRRFDVSTEAYLIRATKVTSEPVLMFCSSPIESGEVLSGYRVDYLVPSRAWPASKLAMPAPPERTVLRNCTGIGFTDRADEEWAELGEVSVECVGIPPYPSMRLPRVAGIIHSGHLAAPGQVAKLRYVRGNVLEERGDDRKIVCQLVNDSARRWGGGVAAQAANRFPQVQKSFSLWLSSLAHKDRLGKVYFGTAGENLILASMVAQRGIGPSEFPRIRYMALETCLKAVAEEALNTGASVHMPRIGTGDARGAWPVIEGLVSDELVGHGVSTTVYDLPPKAG
jgi:O-acetyl-ADP-ribose deacetylase (regulator of RNase III)